MNKNQNHPFLVVGNWKMNYLLSETRRFFDEWKIEIKKHSEIEIKKVQVVIIPSVLSLSEACLCVSSSPFPVTIGAQNAHGEKKGAFTGEISAPMLLELGVFLVLIGHSERRQFFGETNSSAAQRLEGLLAQGLSVIFCVGANYEEELKALLEIQILDPEKFIIAYEPVWAIGTGVSASPEQIQKDHQWIRHFLSQNFNSAFAKKVRLIYGGSVTPENCVSIANCFDVDGLLIGGVSLSPQKFLEVIRKVGLL